MCLYEKGGFFKAHVDTVHGASHCATGLVCLPSEHTGGELIVRKGNHQVQHSFAKKSQLSNRKEFQTATFFTDCEHEVLPVTSGTRIVLNYDILKTSLETEDDINSKSEIEEEEKTESDTEEEEDSSKSEGILFLCTLDDSYLEPNRITNPHQGF
ncbi:hypothetical protein FDP41_006300 [Naegleria fowleri]|uniref:Fe2OG dioxygenase domain-containing protein n=1 Tax=Naegleria fowleri TaxID=5763 RepID=A0A6A5BJ33_NAEFO|nr:uncharacterized protein FDP41_006300 [Naegleria fowleri]KAF0974826.1 hypothetical protein FDP41_006300 [Naegleria fowleri]